MGYYEGNISDLSVGNNNGYGFGGEWGGLIGLLIVASLFGGYGFGGRGFGGGTICGTPATQADLASGFNNSAVLSSLNDIKLGQTQAINYNNQGFNGLNTSILTGVNTLGNGISTLGYNLTQQISGCCCDIRGAIADVKYANEKQTCDIVNAINMGNQRLIDIYTSDKIDTLNRKLAIAEGQISQSNQTATLLNAINRTPVAAYTVPNPYCCYNYTSFANPCGNGCVGVQ